MTLAVKRMVLLWHLGEDLEGLLAWIDLSRPVTCDLSSIPVAPTISSGSVLRTPGTHPKHLRYGGGPGAV